MASAKTMAIATTRLMHLSVFPSGGKNVRPTFLAVIGQVCTSLLNLTLQYFIAVHCQCVYMYTCLRIETSKLLVAKGTCMPYVNSGTLIISIFFIIIIL